MDYLPKGHTLNAEYYSSLLVQLKDILKEKCCGKVTKGVLFLHDNAPAHWALSTQKKLAYLGFQCLDHPPYSPDLAPSDYHLCPGLKKTIELAYNLLHGQFHSVQAGTEKLHFPLSGLFSGYALYVYL